jgi:hypothetical protein
MIICTFTKEIEYHTKTRRKIVSFPINSMRAQSMLAAFRAQISLTALVTSHTRLCARSHLENIRRETCVDSQKKTHSAIRLHVKCFITTTQY